MSKSTHQRRVQQAKNQRVAQRTAQRRQRRTLIIVGLVVAPLVATVAIVALGSSEPTVNAGTCEPAPTPRADDIRFAAPESGAAASVSTMTLDTNCGPIEITLDPKASATVDSMAFLSQQGFYNNTICHRLTTAGIFVLQCGDPAGNGTSGPGYAVPDENLPTADASGAAVYPRGTVAMANAGPNTSGSQFFIVYQDSPLPPAYTVWGQVTAGLEIVDAVAAAGVANGLQDGTPAQPIGIRQVTLG